MGVHHYRLELFPPAAAKDLLADPEGANVWENQPSEKVLHDLRQLLTKDTSWDGIEEYESQAEYGSDLRIWRTEAAGPVESIQFRFSPVADDQALLERFLSIAAASNLLVYSWATRRVLQPELSSVLEDMRTTPAFRFVSDPEGAILDAAKNLDPRE